MTSRSSIILLAAYSLLLISIGFWIGSGVEPKTVTMTKELIVPKSKLQKKKSAIPEIIYKYIPVKAELLVEECVEIPAELAETDFLVTDPAPISVKPEQVTFSYFNPTTHRYQQDVYNVSASPWRGSLNFVGGLDVIRRTPLVGIDAQLGYKRLAIFARAETNLVIGRIEAGVRIKLF